MPQLVEQLESMVADSAEFRSAVGAADAAEAMERIHYDYALLDEQGLDADLGLTRFADLLPCAVIMACEQLAYLGLSSYAEQHRLRASGSLGLLLLAADVTNGQVASQGLAARKQSVLSFASFYGTVIHQVSQLAGMDLDGAERLPINRITMDVPPLRSHPYLDAAINPVTGEFAPFWLVGFSVHWK